MIILYLAGITVFGFYYKSHIKTAKDYFLANRSLPWWVTGHSIIGTNIGSNDYIGAAVNAYSIESARANFEWIGAIPAMTLSALSFIPFFWRAGVYYIPEYVGLRYNNIVRFIAACSMSIFSVVIVGVFLWATAIMLQTYLGLSIWFSIFITATVVGFYTISGGLVAVAITDTIQTFIMFLSATIVAVIGIKTIGGLDSFIETLKVNYPDHLNAFLPANHPTFPWHGVIPGLGLVLSPAYWCANQAILQRTFGARSKWDGKASMIFAAMIIFYNYNAAQIIIRDFLYTPFFYFLAKNNNHFLLFIDETLINECKWHIHHDTYNSYTTSSYGCYRHVCCRLVWYYVFAQEE